MSHLPKAQGEKLLKTVINEAYFYHYFLIITKGTCMRDGSGLCSRVLYRFRGVDLCQRPSPNRCDATAGSKTLLQGQKLFRWPETSEGSAQTGSPAIGVRVQRK